MAYVDGFVVVVLKKNVKAYVAMAKKCSRIFREHGALEFRECVGEDLDAKMGMVQRVLRQAGAADEFSERLPGLNAQLLTRPLP